MSIMQVSPNIDEYCIEQNFTWKKFPCQENKLSILIIYDDNTIMQMKNLVNKLLLIFPEKFFYDDIKNNWIKLPLDSNGYKVPFLDKISSVSSISNINSATAIIDIDDLILEDPKYYEDYKDYKILPLTGSGKIIHPEENQKKIFEPISNMKIDNLDRNTKIFKILDYRTFITHIICIANIKNIEKSYYEKFDIIFFTTLDIVNTFSSSRTYRQFGSGLVLPNKVFVTNLKEMKNNMSLYSL